MAARREGARGETRKTGAGLRSHLEGLEALLNGAVLVGEHLDDLQRLTNVEAVDAEEELRSAAQTVKLDGGYDLTDFASWEPFAAWNPQNAAMASLILAGLSVLAAAWVPLAYCHYGCPTGALLDYLRDQPSRFLKPADAGAALLLVASARCSARHRVVSPSAGCGRAGNPWIRR